jgi:carboxylate-amine ligase
VNAFPLSGTMPWVQTWDEFNAYYDKMHGYGIVQSMKDFYWDVRPKPEYGTVEIRVCDTPLTVDRAAQLAGFAQALAGWLWHERPALSADLYLAHSYNRFQACRHGLAGSLVDAATGATVALADDLQATLRRVTPHARALGGEPALEALQAAVADEGNDAAWLRERLAQSGTLPDVVRQQAARFMG